jgi:hypothetical protein
MLYVELKTLLLKIKRNMKDIAEHARNKLQVKQLTVLIRVWTLSTFIDVRILIY